MIKTSSGHHYESILITGASGGLGSAIALEYAATGITLFLSGRNEKNLRETARQCKNKGAHPYIKIVDVCDKDAMQEWIISCDKHSPIDLVIANAGISGGTGGAMNEEGESAAQIEKMFAVNVGGVFNTLLPAIPFMKSRKQGQLAIVSSLAGFRGMPGAPAYCASKAAVKSYGEGLAGQLAPDNIGVSVICPGFVQTKMTDANDFYMPFLMPAGQAARIIIKGLQNKKGRIAFPWPMLIGAWFINLLPNGLVSWVSTMTPKKPAQKL